MNDEIVKMDKDKLVLIIEYAYLMSRHISPVNIHGFDGMMCDFYRQMSCQISNSDNIKDIELDELDINVLEKMKNAIEE